MPHTKSDSSSPIGQPPADATQPDGRRNNGRHLLDPAHKTELSKARPLTPQKLTKQAWQRINDELGFDPLRAAVAIAKGEMLTADHPLLPLLEDTLTNWMKKAATGQGIETEEIADFLEIAIRYLTDSWVSHELRSKHTLELLKYIYPQRKAIDMQHSGNVGLDLGVKPLSPDEVKSFNRKFDDHF